MLRKDHSPASHFQIPAERLPLPSCTAHHALPVFVLPAPLDSSQSPGGPSAQTSVFAGLTVW